MKKVVHIVNCMSRTGGAERLILDLARCRDNGPTPVIAWWGSDNSLRDDSDGAVDLIALHPFSFAALRRALSAIRDCDVVHLHLFPTLYLGPFIPKPVLYTEHNTWNRRRDKPSLRGLERWCYSRIDKVAAISEATAESLAQWLGRPPPRMSVIPNGIALDRFSRSPRAFRGRQSIVIGMAARFAQEKDHETLIRAVSLLPLEFSVRLASAGPLLESMKALAYKLEMGDRVEFVGVVMDMPGFYRGLDIYVQSSHADGFSLVAVEAMASGLPTLVSNVAGLCSTVASDELLFEHASPDDLARRILEITSSAEKYESCSRYCVSQAVVFNIRETSRLYEVAYREICDVSTG